MRGSGVSGEKARLSDKAGCLRECGAGEAKPREIASGIGQRRAR